MSVGAQDILSGLDYRYVGAGGLEYERALRLFIPPTSPRSSVKVTDLGGGRDAAAAQASRAEQQKAATRVTSATALGDYLCDLDKTFSLALKTMLVTMLSVVVALSDLYWFMRTGQTVLHPVLDFIVLIAALGMFVVATVSALSVRKYIRLAVREILGGVLSRVEARS